MADVSRDFFCERGACGQDVQIVDREWPSGEIPLTQATYERGLDLGLRVLWAGLALASAEDLAAFVAFTITQRTEAVRSLAGGSLPSSDSGLRDAANAAFADAAQGDRRRRDEGRALRELAEDKALDAPTPVEAMIASRRALRAIDASGGNGGVAQREQTDFLANRVIPGGIR